ncbi:MAG TPA: hypothetical protein VHW00_23985 [Thermoanaerobaculia bacterium]|nr:hypothetical protein [Thermoanaerobaculia bacterium]
MTLDTLRTSPAVRFLGLTRRGASALRNHGWSVREAAVIGGDVADHVAIRRWEQKRMTADVRLVVRYDGTSSPIVFSATESAAEALRAFGEPALITPPAMRVKAALFSSDDPAFATLLDDAFYTTRALVHALDEHQRDVEATDAETYRESELTPGPATPHATLIHGVVLTEAPLWLLGENDRLSSRASIRVIRTSGASGEREWIDVVQSDSFDAYAESVTRHYVAAMKKRKFA